MILKGVLFELHDTLAYLSNPLGSEEVSEFLLEHGYEVYPQSWDAASHYVGMIDYPKHGYSNRQAFLKQVLHRLDTQIDNKSLQNLASLYDQRNAYTLFPDTTPAVLKTKQLGMKTAIVTTIPDFVFHSAIEPIKDCFDVIMTGYKAGCEKSNPLMHRKTLKELDVIPDQAVMIGDELLVDVKSQRNSASTQSCLTEKTRVKASQTKPTTKPQH